MVQMEERNADDAKAAAEREKARQQTGKAKAEQKNAAAAESEGKAEACNKARRDYLNRMNALRLYEEEPNGERRYLTSEELDASRASAKAAMDSLCT
jgi:hypothetical protein